MKTISPETHQSQSIRRRILYPLGAVLFLLILASVGSVYWIQQQTIREKVAMRIRGVEILFRERLQNQSILLEGLSYLIRSKKELEAAWLAQDPARIKALAWPLFQHLQKNYRVLQLTLLNPDGKVSFPFHEGPVLDSPTVPHVLNPASYLEGSSYELEIAKSGQFYLRQRSSWEVDGEKLGWIDIAQELDRDIVTMEKVLGVTLFITARKNRIERSEWEKHFLLKEIQNPWDLFSDYVIMDESLDEVFPTLQPLRKLYEGGQKNVSFDFVIGNKTYQTGFVPLTDPQGEEIGDLVVLTDVTREKKFLWQLGLGLIALSLGVGGALMWFFYLYIGRIEKQMLDNQNYLRLEIEEREWAQKVQQESETRYQELVENANSIILRMDTKGNVTFFNEFAQKFFGYSEEEILGQNVLETIVPKTESTSGRGLEDMMEEMVKNPGAFTNHVNENISKDGRRFWIAWANKIVFDENRKACEVLCVGNDITERKRAEEELEKTAQELVRSNRELEQFAYVASHDLQEPLRKINAFSDLLMGKENVGLDEESKDYLKRMRSAATRMSRLIQDLLAYSRVTTKQTPFETVDLKQTVDEVLSDLEVRVKETGGKVEVGVLEKISADPLQMRQLFQNLIGNALKYRKKEVPPVVKVIPSMEDKHFYEIKIEDNGIGFDEKYKDRIFAPFQRLHTREEYEGTGIGLAICKKIVERHGGVLEVHSQPEAGSTFIIRLPKKLILEEKRA